MRFVASRLTHRGHVRPNNEDTAVAITRSGRVTLAVCDGMGGHAGGEVASSVAADAVIRYEGGEVRRVVALANGAVWDRGRRDPALSKMGTTLTMATVSPHGNLTIGHVGDSRAYLLRNDALFRLTKDHTLAQQLVDAKRMTPEEAERSEISHILLRVVGMGPSVVIDHITERMRVGDAILVCSDGLHGPVDDTEIAACLRGARGDAYESCLALAGRALAAGGPDNISVAVAWCLPGETRNPDTPHRPRGARR